LPVEERETVDGCLRQIDFLDAEIAAVERQVAADALGSPEIKRLMTVPGVNVIVAATFLAAVGDITRFRTPRQLVGISGSTRACASQAARRRRTAGSQSKARRRPGTRSTRRPGAWCASPARCTPSTSASAAAAATRSRSSPPRKLACLFWCMLTRGEDYAFQQPSLTRKKLRRLELQAGSR
jgi:transposase